MSFWKELLAEMADAWIVWREIATHAWALLFAFIMWAFAPSWITTLWFAIIVAAFAAFGIRGALECAEKRRDERE